MASKQLCRYAFTHWLEGDDSEASMATLDEHLKKCARRWVYQEEAGESGKKHLQGRVSFKVGVRVGEVSGKLGITVHASPEHDTKGSDFYCMKNETRVSGPYTDKDEKQEIPRQVTEIKDLYRWQERIIVMAQEWDTRTIHVIYDPDGNKGKSTLVTWMGVHNLAKQLPFCNDFKDLLRMCYDIGPRRAYIVDMPRALNKDKLFQLYGAIEMIKGGYCYDDRYKFQDRYFDCPNIFIFTNRIPDTDLLSKDRWKLWQIKNLELVPFQLDCIL